MVNSEELIGTTEHLTLYTWCRLSRCRYNRVRLSRAKRLIYEAKYMVRINVFRSILRGTLFHLSMPGRCTLRTYNTSHAS